jgi:hypothetical protein
MKKILITLIIMNLTIYFSIKLNTYVELTHLSNEL